MTLHLSDDRGKSRAHPVVQLTDRTYHPLTKIDLADGIVLEAVEQIVAKKAHPVATLAYSWYRPNAGINAIEELGDGAGFRTLPAGDLELFRVVNLFDHRLMAAVGGEFCIAYRRVTLLDGAF
jgi:hypothetical protein